LRNDFVVFCKEFADIYFLQKLLGMTGQYDVYLFLINRSILSTNNFSNENDSLFAETKIHAKWLKEGFFVCYVVVGSM